MTDKAEQEEELLPISQAARFFDKSIAWLRWKERTGEFVREDGSEILPERTPLKKAAAGQRRYTLTDIDEMSKALLRSGTLTEEEFESIQKRVEAFR